MNSVVFDDGARGGAIPEIAVLRFGVLELSGADRGDDALIPDLLQHAELTHAGVGLGAKLRVGVNPGLVDAAPSLL
jgi:hypothetical protein